MSLINQIKKVESVARLLEPTTEEQTTLSQTVMNYGTQFVADLPNAPAYYPRPDNGRALLEAPISESGIPIEKALQLLHENLNTVGINTASSRFMGYIPGGGLIHSALGDYLAAISNKYAGIFYAGPGAVRIENMLIRWMNEVVSYPTTATGSLTSGGSIANLTALCTARDAHDIYGPTIQKSVVYLTEHAHHSIHKAIRLSGLRDIIQRTIPVDKQYRMDANLLQQTILADKKAGLNPWLIVISAGTTNTGSVDPIIPISQIAEQNQLWLHIDGAYGGFFTLCPEGASALKGMHHADSIVIDPHKTLFLPYGTGAVLIKDGKKLFESFSMSADYMQDALSATEESSPADLSPELTRHFRGLRLWLPLQLLGVAPFRAALSEKILLTRYFHEQLSELPGFELGPYPDLSVATYRYLPPRGDTNLFNQQLIEKIQQKGRVFITSTQIDGAFTLRLAVSSFRTHLPDIDETIDALKNGVTELLDN